MPSEVRRSTSVQPSTRDLKGTPSFRSRGNSRSGAEQPLHRERSIWRTSNGAKSNCVLGWNFECESRRARRSNLQTTTMLGAEASAEATDDGADAARRDAWRVE